MDLIYLLIYFINLKMANCCSILLISISYVYPLLIIENTLKFYQLFCPFKCVSISWGINNGFLFSFFLFFHWEESLDFMYYHFIFYLLVTYLTVLVVIANCNAFIVLLSKKHIVWKEKGQTLWSINDTEEYCGTLETNWSLMETWLWFF